MVALADRTKLFDRRARSAYLNSKSHKSRVCTCCSPSRGVPVSNHPADDLREMKMQTDLLWKPGPKNSAKIPFR